MSWDFTKPLESLNSRPTPYRYDPEAAEKLLDEAGYPRGADGVRFKTIYEHYEFFDLGYYQIAMDYLRQIGIDVETQIVTRAEYIEKSLNHTSLGLRSDVWAMENGAVAPLDTYWSKNGWRPNNVIDPYSMSTTRTPGPLPR